MVLTVDFWWKLNWDFVDLVWICNCACNHFDQFGFVCYKLHIVDDDASDALHLKSLFIKANILSSKWQPTLSSAIFDSIIIFTYACFIHIIRIMCIIIYPHTHHHNRHDPQVYQWRHTWTSFNKIHWVSSFYFITLTQSFSKKILMMMMMITQIMLMMMMWWWRWRWC